MANKKINQLVAKTTIQSTDLFPIGDATTGTLYKKTIADLQAAIGGAVISVNGLVGTVVLDADDILETATPTNRYFTDARARAAISLTTTGSSGASTYSSSTGVLNVPTYTLAGLGGITATFLSGGTGITYNSSTGVISYSGTVYTDSSIRGLVSAGTGLSYNSSTGVFSYSGTVYTDSSIRALFSGTSPITYNSTTGAIGITGANLTESTSSVLTITGGTGALLSAASIQVKQASGSQSGFLSSTDWTTFNNKQSALTNPVTGTGTSGHVTFWNGSGTITGDAAHFWDNTNKRLGIGTTSPSYPLEVKSTGVDSTIWGYNIAQFGDAQTNNNGLRIGTSSSTSGLTNLIAATASAASQLGFWTFSGSSWGERLRISAAGNVGIGTSSPGSYDPSGNNLVVYEAGNAGITIATGSTNFGSIFFARETGTAGAYRGYIEYGQSSDYMGFGTVSTERMRITSGGNVGIGNTSPSYKLQVSGTSGTGARLIQVDGTGTAYNLISVINDGCQLFLAAESSTAGTVATGSLAYAGVIDTNTNTALQFATFATVRMTVTNGGNILMGTTTDNGERLYVSGSIRATGTITANSDITLKKNLAKIENALEKVEQINGYTYEFKADDSKRHAGVIAQEIQGVLPEIVNKGNDGLLGVEYGNISALLIEAIKEQQAQINELKALLNK